jgi:hypothetical protein
LRSLSCEQQEGLLCGAALQGGGYCAGALNGSVAIYSATGHLECVQVCHRGAVSALLSGHDHILFVSGSESGDVKLWRTSMELLRVFKCDAPVLSLLWQDIGEQRLLWCATESGAIAVYDIKTGDIVDSMRGHHSPVSSLSSNQGEFKVWSTSLDGEVIAWDPVTRSVIYRTTHDGPVLGMLSTSRSAVLRMWAIGIHSVVHSYLSQAVLDEENDTQILLDEAIHQVKAQHDEIQRLTKRSPLVTYLSSVAAEEQTCREGIIESWIDSTEQLFLAYLLTQRIVEATVAECSTLRDEVRYFRDMVVQEVASRPPPTSSQTTGTSPFRVDPPLQQRDDQIRQLQSEALRLSKLLAEKSESEQANRIEELDRLHRLLRGAREDAESARKQAQSAKVALAEVNEKALLLSKKLEAAETELRGSQMNEQRLMQRLQEAEMRDNSASESMTLEINELRLTLQQERDAHIAERNRLQGDLLAMKAPWDAMKRALSQAHDALDFARAEASAEINQLNKKIDEQNETIRRLREKR